MSTSNEYDFQNVCRTCMATGNLKSLYEKYSVHDSLHEILTMCTSMEFREDDGLSFQICLNCINELYRCYKFALKCRQTDTALRISLQQATDSSYYEQNYDPAKDPLELEIPEMKHEPDIEIIEIKHEVDDESENSMADSFEMVAVEPISQLNEMFQIKNEEINENIANISGMPTLQDSIQYQAEEVIECEDCQTCFESYMLLKQHQKWECEATTTSSNSGEKQYPCMFCDETFNAKIYLTIHLRTHSDWKPFACTLCDKTFNVKTSLNIHFRTHTGEKPFACEYCDARFRQQQHLTGHMKTQHSKGRARSKRPQTAAKLTYKCAECAAMFSRKFQLNSHLRKHAREKNSYTCTICNTTFKNQPSLTFHMYTHTGEKPYACTICDASFNLESNLTCHLRIHSY